MKNKIEWVQIFYCQDINNIYKGNANETWMALIPREGNLYRHVHYDLNNGDESNRIETMVFVPFKN